MYKISTKAFGMWCLPIYFSESDLHGYNGILCLALRELELNSIKSGNDRQDSDNSGQNSPFYSIHNSLKNPKEFLNSQLDSQNDFLILTQQENQNFDPDDSFNGLYTDPNASGKSLRYNINSAEKSLKEAIRLNPSGSMYMYFLLQIFLAKKEFNHAEIALDELLSKNPKDLISLKFALQVQKLLLIDLESKLALTRSSLSDFEKENLGFSESDISLSINSAKTKWSDLSKRILTIDPFADINNILLPFLIHCKDQNTESDLSEAIEILTTRIDYGIFNSPKNQSKTRQRPLEVPFFLVQIFFSRPIRVRKTW
ncbi:hypothetical protein AYI68_g1526 [Smittium mucronatum]|uniref:Uncharacterized protein n=1 Tax=Smittium mucronatum TaxID=133383 RepID=A0A1R0H506_9FUNG|nr:hypothetical protein AYI68_g1526 [Smittium mucronatum]